MNGFSASKSASKSIMRTPSISSASESCDNSKSGLASRTGGNSCAPFSLGGASPWVGTSGLVIVLAAIVAIGLGALVMVG